MVTIIDYAVSVNSETGEEFMSLILEGDIEFIKSKATGRLYATAKRAKIPSTFNEYKCATLIGTQLPGNVIKVPCEPYEYIVPETGEIIELSFSYEYSDVVGDEKPQPSTTTKPTSVNLRTDSFSKNGLHEHVA